MGVDDDQCGCSRTSEGASRTVSDQQGRENIFTLDLYQLLLLHEPYYYPSSL
jgi:hypothetical protein